MNEDLARKLKDAGFPIRGPVEMVTKRPTLSELIEAINDHVKLEWFPKTRWAYANCCDRNDHQQTGKTPEEAVANLLLELNNKKELECHCERAKELLREYLEAEVIEKDFALQVRCPDCEKWIGQASEGYPLPADFSKMRGIHKIELKKKL